MVIAFLITRHDSVIYLLMTQNLESVVHGFLSPNDVCVQELLM